ncbi:MAG: cell division topological specificity factor MinE [Anaerolineales bacterium]
MANFIQKIFSREPNSADRAKDRLRLVLINNRTDLSATGMEALKDDLLEVLNL